MNNDQLVRDILMSNMSVCPPIDPTPTVLHPDDVYNCPDEAYMRFWGRVWTLEEKDAFVMRWYNRESWPERLKDENPKEEMIRKELLEKCGINEEMLGAPKMIKDTIDPKLRDKMDIDRRLMSLEMSEPFYESIVEIVAEKAEGSFGKYEEDNEKERYKYAHNCTLNLIDWLADKAREIGDD